VRRRTGDRSGRTAYVLPADHDAHRHMLTVEARLSSEIIALRAEVHDLRATR
jgi:hypothetical protein